MLSNVIETASRCLYYRRYYSPRLPGIVDELWSQAILPGFWSWCLENTVRHGAYAPALLLLETRTGRRADDVRMERVTSQTGSTRFNVIGWDTMCSGGVVPLFCSSREYWNCGACQRGRDGSTPLTAGEGQVTCKLTASAYEEAMQQYYISS